MDFLEIPEAFELMRLVSRERLVICVTIDKVGFQYLTKYIPYPFDFVILCILGLPIDLDTLLFLIVHLLSLLILSKLIIFFRFNYKLIISLHFIHTFLLSTCFYRILHYKLIKQFCSIAAKLKTLD